MLRRSRDVQNQTSPAVTSRITGSSRRYFEQYDEIGGQWNVRSPHSGVWPSMVTNTSRWLTCFSDLALEPEAAIFPSNKEILAYLKRYARRFDILSRVRFGTRVELIERNPQGVGWLVRSNDAEEKSKLDGL